MARYAIRYFSNALVYAPGVTVGVNSWTFFEIMYILEKRWMVLILVALRALRTGHINLRIWIGLLFMEQMTMVRPEEDGAVRVRDEGH